MASQLQTRAARAALRTLLASPPSLLRRLAGAPRHNDRGHELDLQTQVILRGMARRPAPAEMGVARLRQDFDLQAPIVDFAPIAMQRVENRSIPQPYGRIPVRVYEPGPRTGPPRPICLYFHGGGFMLGSLGSHDGICRYLASWADCVVVSVDYRLSPEHRFPAAVHDAIAAFRWVAARASELGGDPTRLAVAGDSAGGNLAAVVAAQLRGEAAKPVFQLLVYPATDLTRSHASHGTYSRGFLLEEPSIDYFLDNYLTDAAREMHDPLGSPLWAPDVRGACAAHVVVAGFDPLRDEGESYARKLAAAGVPVELRCEESLVHGFFSMGAVVDRARAAIEIAAESLAKGLRAGAPRKRRSFAASRDVVR
jgi:acetyl esterase